MAEVPARSLTTRSGQPLIGIPVWEGPDEVVRYFASEDEADEAVANGAAGVERALSGKYLLDTPFLAALLNNRAGAVSLATPWIAASEAATSALVYAEVIEYIKPSQRYGQHYAALRSLLAGVYPYFLTFSILERYADIRLSLRRGQLIGDIDTLIAATALEHDLTIVTLDPDFQRVPDLRVMFLTRNQIV
jgi:tRNA(fMet)-specific endonuclease VapC